MSTTQPPTRPPAETTPKPRAPRKPRPAGTSVADTPAGGKLQQLLDNAKASGVASVTDISKGRKPESEGTPASELNKQQQAARQQQASRSQAEGSAGGRSVTGQPGQPEGERTTAAEKRAIAKAAAEAKARAAAAAPRAASSSIPEKLSKSALEASLKKGKLPGTISAKRQALMAQIKAEAGKRSKDPGWKYVAGLTVEQIAVLVGSHVEVMSGAVKMLAKGGAVSDRRS
jgi:hypothetical protein